MVLAQGQNQASKASINTAPSDTEKKNSAELTAVFHSQPIPVSTPAQTACEAPKPPTPLMGSAKERLEVVVTARDCQISASSINRRSAIQAMLAEQVQASKV